MRSKVIHRNAIMPHLHQQSIILLRPWVIRLWVLLTAGIHRVCRLALQLLIRLQIFLQPLHILIRNIRQSADIHVVSQVIQFHRHRQLVCLHASNKFVIRLLLRPFRHASQRLDYLHPEALSLKTFKRPLRRILHHIM